MKSLISVLFILLSAGALIGQQRFVASLDGNQEVPPNGPSGAKGTCTIVLNAAQTQITVNCTFSGLGTPATAGHIHGNGVVGVNAPVLFGFTGVPAATSGSIGPLNFAVTAQQVADMRAHRHYVNIHTSAFPGGEIRGQIKQAFTVYDVDGDGRTDPTVFRQSTNTFWFQNSLNGGAKTVTMGTGTGDIFLNNTADFDGDGRGDPLLLKLDALSTATWSIYQTGTNTVRSVQWGNFSVASNDTLAINDYDGDGRQDIAVFRRSTGDWWVIESSTDTARVTHWGTVSDFPSIGDYDGDGKADLTVVRVELGQRVWYTLNSSDGQTVRVVYGASATDGVFFFAPLDLDGDGKQDRSVNRTVNSQRIWFVLRSSDGQSVQFQWGITADTPLFGDYDGDGKTDFVARRNTGG
ncbi:MAG TPA: CHRD domain-containing protein, partial [Pyrinomonadaceae bacterium]|nr:CHRD domain-containing protein [Pyrinomonadaceae bacterium]